MVLFLATLYRSDTLSFPDCLSAKALEVQQGRSFRWINTSTRFGRFCLTTSRKEFESRSSTFPMSNFGTWNLLRKPRFQYIPIPLAGWIPFSSHGLNAHLFSKGVGMIDLRKVLFLVCFEELLPGIISSSFFSDNTPHVIISVVNNIVGKGTGERRSQYNSRYLMSRLFNASLLRSWNR